MAQAKTLLEEADLLKDKVRDAEHNINQLIQQAPADTEQATDQQYMPLSGGALENVGSNNLSLANAEHCWNQYQIRVSIHSFHNFYSDRPPSTHIDRDTATSRSCEIDRILNKRVVPRYRYPTMVVQHLVRFKR